MSKRGRELLKEESDRLVRKKRKKRLSRRLWIRPRLRSSQNDPVLKGK